MYNFLLVIFALVALVGLIVLGFVVLGTSNNIDVIHVDDDFWPYFMTALITFAITIVIVMIAYVIFVKFHIPKPEFVGQSMAHFLSPLSDHLPGFVWTCDFGGLKFL